MNVTQFTMKYIVCFLNTCHRQKSQLVLQKVLYFKSVLMVNRKKVSHIEVIDHKYHVTKILHVWITRFGCKGQNIIYIINT